MNITVKLIFFGIVCALLFACGQKGELYLPDSDDIKSNAIKKSAVAITPQDDVKAVKKKNTEKQIIEEK